MHLSLSLSLAFSLSLSPQFNCRLAMSLAILEAYTRHASEDPRGPSGRGGWRQAGSIMVIIIIIIIISLLSFLVLSLIHQNMIMIMLPLRHGGGRRTGQKEEAGWQEEVRKQTEPAAPNRTERCNFGTVRGSEPNRIGPSHDASEKRRPNRVEPKQSFFGTEPIIFEQVRNRNESNRTGSFLGWAARGRQDGQLRAGRTGSSASIQLRGVPAALLFKARLFPTNG